MLVNISYRTSSDMSYCCKAEAEVRGEWHFGIGKTWEEAKQNLLLKLNNTLGKTAPPPETVDIAVAGEEMETELLPFETAPARVIGEVGRV